jgi:hypothetical protein
MGRTFEQIWYVAYEPHNCTELCLLFPFQYSFHYILCMCNEEWSIQVMI